MTTTTMTQRFETTLTEHDALKVIGSANGDAACAVCEVGPVANHLAGPLAALRPDGHPDSLDQRSGEKRSKEAVDSLIRDATGTDTFTCTCQGQSRHPLAVVITRISAGAFVRPAMNSFIAQQDLEAAVASADVDLLTYHAEPRLDALKILVDRVRAENGGHLPPLVMTAVVPLVQSLAGPSRWDIRSGYVEGWRWSAQWLPGQVFDSANEFMKHPVVFEAVMRRMITGSL